MNTPKLRRKPRANLTTPDRRTGKDTSATTSPGVRYLDIRVAVPADCPPDQVADYLVQHHHATATSPLTVASSSSSGGLYESPVSTKRRCASPAGGFIPILEHHGATLPPPSPLTTTPRRSSPFSPMAKSTGTAETAESSLATALRAASPSLVASLAPPLYSSNSRPGTPHGKESLAESSLARALRFSSPVASPTKASPPVYTTPVSSPRPGTPRSTKSTISSLTSSPYHAATEADETVKKTRLKTELCMHYQKGNPCPFGVNCTYAHGEEELQMTKLMDMHKAGLVDMETYRTRPCWTWVATGSCPFGKRCCSIHDPRIQGDFDSWLTHTETQGNNSATDINVEALHQKIQNEIHCGTPFGDAFLPQADTWNELYQRVGNIFYGGGQHQQQPSSSFQQKETGNKKKANHKAWVDSSTTGRHHNSSSLSPMVKLQIAIFMRGEADFSFKYCPQHVIHGELCMVLQKRAFRLSGTGAKQRVQGVSLRQYNPRSNKDIMVHELAFGPDADPSARPVALWFNLDPNAIVECTTTQAKRFRYKRGLKNVTEPKQRRSALDHLEHFQMIRPHDKDAFDLATDILINRLAMLHAERVVNLKERSEQLAQVRAEKQVLHERFDALLRFWVEFGWPVNRGRAKVDKKTPVPSVDGKYELPQMDTSLDLLDDADSDDANRCEELVDTDDQVVMGQYTLRLWQSFSNCELIGPNKQGSHSSISKHIPTNRRLSVFEKLAEGKEIALDRSLPHIHQDSPYHGKETQVGPDHESERCWKALLLSREELAFENEWDIVREHFDNSRSKKVLSIIQQK